MKFSFNASAITHVAAVFLASAAAFAASPAGQALVSQYPKLSALAGAILALAALYHVPKAA